MTFLKRLRQIRKNREMKEASKFKKVCKYPFNDPKDRNFHFCGKEAVEGRSPYCQEHTDLCYIKESATKRRDIVGILPKKRA